jgi:PAS domain S-box-containing protein
LKESHVRNFVGPVPPRILSGAGERLSTMDDQIKSRWTARAAASIGFRYGLALVSVAAAFGLAHTFLYFHLPQPFTALALSAIAITFWFGGTMPGILATLFSLVVRDYFFETDVHAVSRVLYDLVFLLFALLMTEVTREQHELEGKVVKRTAELTQANQDLRLEIAERKQAEYLTGQVFECSPDGVFIIGRDYRYRRVNPVYERNRGIPAEKMVGMHVAEVEDNKMFEQKIKPHLDRCFAGEDVSYGDWFGDPPKRRYLAVSYSPLRPNPEHVEAALVIRRDLTEHILAEEALRDAQADLAHVNRITTMGELTASLSHEVNQPIAAALTDANTCLRWLTRDHPDLAEAREAASRMVRDATRAGEIISRIRLLFKKGSQPRELMDVNEVIGSMIVLLQGEALRNSVALRTELAKDLPHIMGDRVQLQQVMMNLMLNSIDAMKDVDGTRELIINSQPAEDEKLMVTVSDTGVGLPPQQADQIFNAFFTTKIHGTGMGLRISHSIIESHGGRLWAASNSPRGATFHFTLPTKVEATE